MALEQQSFDSYGQWSEHADAWLAPAEGRGDSVCLDARGRPCQDVTDFLRARSQGTFPVRWFWPDQLANALGQALASGVRAEGRIAALERWCGLDGVDGYDRDVAEQGLERAALARESGASVVALPARRAAGGAR